MVTYLTQDLQTSWLSPKSHLPPWSCCRSWGQACLVSWQVIPVASSDMKFVPTKPKKMCLWKTFSKRFPTAFLRIAVGVFHDPVSGKSCKLAAVFLLFSGLGERQSASSSSQPFTAVRVVITHPWVLRNPTKKTKPSKFIYINYVSLNLLELLIFYYCF